MKSQQSILPLVDLVFLALGGILGAIMRESRSIRLSDVKEDPRSVGFPKGHPPMGSFLGVPIMAGTKDP